MPSGFSDLSRGIFDRLNFYTDDQRKRDDEKRGQVLGVLTGLLERADPESQGILFGHIGDVLNLKGKEKAGWAGLWDRFKGTSQGRTEEALGGKLQQILGQVRGPFQEQAIQQERPTATTSVAGPGGMLMELPTSLAPTLPTATARTPGGIYLRDPRQEKLNEIQTRYESQAQIMNDRMYEQARLRSEEREAAKAQDLRNRKTMADYETHIKDLKDVRELASRMQIQPANRGKRLDELLGMAADSLDVERGLKLGTMRQRIELMKDQGAAARAEAQGLRTGEAMTPGQSRQEAANRALQQEITKQRSSWSIARDEVKAKQRAYDSTVAGLQQIAQKYGVQFDPNSGTFQGDPVKVITAETFADMGSQGVMERARKLAEDIQTAKGRAKSAWDTATGSYGRYFKVTPGEGEDYFMGELDVTPPFAAPRSQDKLGQPGATPKSQGAPSFYGTPGPTRTQPGEGATRLTAPKSSALGSAPPPITMELRPKNLNIQLPNPNLTGREKMEGAMIPRPGVTMRMGVSGSQMLEGQVFEIDGVKYQVMPGGSTGEKDKQGFFTYRVKRIN